MDMAKSAYMYGVEDDCTDWNTDGYCLLGQAAFALPRRMAVLSQ